MSGPSYRGSVSYTVPVTSGTYADDLTATGGSNQGLLAMPANDGISPPLLGVTAVAEALPAGATVELWILRPDADPTALASYVLAIANWISGINVLATQVLTSVAGALIRVKSGGTAGTATLDYWAD